MNIYMITSISLSLSLLNYILVESILSHHSNNTKKCLYIRILSFIKYYKNTFLMLNQNEVNNWINMLNYAFLYNNYYLHQSIHIIYLDYK